MSETPNVWAVIPVKSLAAGKSRLAAVLCASDREILARYFFRRTLDVVCGVSTLGGVIVISADDEVLATANESRAIALREGRPTGLNEALTAGAKEAISQGATHVMTVSIDLPYLCAEDLEGVIEAVPPPDRPSVVIAPDALNAGTNVLVVGPPLAIPYSYGIDSFNAHKRSAQAAGMTLGKVHRPGLLFDVDSPADLNAWRARETEDAFPVPIRLPALTNSPTVPPQGIGT